LSDQPQRPSSDQPEPDRHPEQPQDQQGQHAAGGQAPYDQAPYGQAPYGQAPYDKAPYGQAPYGQYPTEPARRNGLAVTALVLGIVAILLSFIPAIGMVSFLLGPLAIVFGIIALVKKQKKGLSITGIVLGALAAIIAGVITAILAMLATQLTGEHTVEYIVTAESPGTVSYLDGEAGIQEQITGDWSTEITFNGLPVGALSVATEGGAVTCEIIMDGTSIVQNSGEGQVDCISGEVTGDFSG
jgi:hypothetical protein